MAGAGKPVCAAYPGDTMPVAEWKEVPAAGADSEALSASEPDAKRTLAKRRRAAQAAASLVDLDTSNATRAAAPDAREADQRAALAIRVS
jgi:hypothetical protein